VPSFRFTLLSRVFASGVWGGLVERAQAVETWSRGWRRGVGRNANRRKNGKTRDGDEYGS